MRTVERIEAKTQTEDKLKKTAAYARVSLGTDDMLHSFAAQVSYYNDLIQQNPEWEFAGVYSDFAETGTKENRPEFQKMLTDCREGKIDQIITKSISRFARNTLTLLDTVRELKDLGIDVYFEEQEIHTLSGDGELMLTILASYAQEESRSVSENIKWRKRKDMQEGRTKPVKAYGYDYDKKNQKLVINQKQAEVVRRMFSLYLEGNGASAIAGLLTAEGIPTPTGKEKWRNCVVLRLLQNETMRGNTLCQQTYVTDHISKKQVNNKGDLPMYLLKGTHEAIIDDETFEAVQAEMARRGAAGGLNEYEGLAFRKLILCEKCGRLFIHNTNGRKWWKQPVWRCGGHDKRTNPEGCPSRDIPEDILMQKTCSVLGLQEFDGEEVKKRVRQIRVPKHHMLIFDLKTGESIATVWEPKKKGPKHDYDGKRY